MNISHPAIQDTLNERELYEKLLPLDNARIVELGCGTGVHTRNIASNGLNREIVAYEVDTIQHELNSSAKLAGDKGLSNITFKLGGAEKIDEAAESVDVVMMFKSLHHVPIEEMPTALLEISRVLKPGGLAYISEPIFDGQFNDVLRLFHDEQHVRQCAFDSLCAAVDEKTLTLVEQVFFHSPVHFDNFVDLDKRIIQATHSDHQLDAETYKAVQIAFEKHMTAQGANFLAPMRVDLLRKN